MKKLIVLLLPAAAIFLFACNLSNTSNQHDGHDMAGMEKKHETAAPAEGIKEIAVTYTHVDPNAAKVIKEAFSHYLHMQHALAGDNAPEAATGAKAFLAVLSKLDKSFLTAAQKVEFDQLEGHLKEHAKQIENNASDIDAQRIQFTVLSEKAWEMAKAFGAGKTVYQVHCPMANDNEGAMWLSDSRDISNPYFGKDMLTCGSIQESIQ